jgi:protein-S-isoprenylcysteine O-methyltransferase Ste14
MDRQLLTIISVSVFLVLALLVRPALLRLRTGKWGFNGLSGPVGSAAWWGGVSFAGALVLIPVALVCDAPSAPLFLPGVVAMLGGLLLTLIAQSSMGASWRIGVDATEKTHLVTTGLYSIVRNPIFTGMGLFGLGLVLVWPNFASVASLGFLVIGVELQVRFVEEPYLKRVHGEAWTAWASRVGRFLPSPRPSPEGRGC